MIVSKPIDDGGVPDNFTGDPRTLLPNFFYRIAGEWQPHPRKNAVSLRRWRLTMAGRSQVLQIQIKLLPVTIMVKAGISIFHRYRLLAHAAWGVGNILGATTSAEDAKYDLAAITALWMERSRSDRFTRMTTLALDINQGYAVPYGARVVSNWLAMAVQDQTQPTYGITGAQLTGQMVKEYSNQVIRVFLNCISPNLLGLVAPELARFVPFAGFIIRTEVNRRQFKEICAVAETYYRYKMRAAD